MAYTRLPLSDFKAKYVAFSTLTETPYAAWATEAEADIDARYGDMQQRVTELLTAHYLASQAIGLSASAAALATTGATSFKSGTFSASISDSAAAARTKGGFGSTTYGIQLQALQRRLFAGARLVRGAC